MSALSIQPTFPIFTETDGQPLEDGYIWLGVANLDPQGNPINVYWDAALTQLAGQPIRTQGGYPVNSGTPARLYVNSNYSIQVQNKNGSVVYSAPEATERYSSDLISFIQAGAGAVQRTAQNKMRDAIDVKDFGAVGDGVADDTAAVQAAVNYCVANGFNLTVSGMCLLTSSVNIDRIVDGANVRDYFIISSSNGGGFVVTTPIAMFDTSLPFNGVNPISQQVYFSKLYFLGNAGASYVLDAQKFLRIRFDGCSFNAIRCGDSPIYLQSFYFTNNTIWAGVGTFWKCGGIAYDHKFIGNSVEQYHGDVFDLGTTNGVTFVGNLIQGLYLDGTAIRANNGGAALTIHGNYFEANKCDIDLSGTQALYGVSIMGNTMWDAYHDTNPVLYPRIKWSSSIAGCVSSSNQCYGTLHQMVAPGQNLWVQDVNVAPTGTLYNYGPQSLIQSNLLINSGDGGVNLGGVIYGYGITGNGGYLELGVRNSFGNFTNGMTIDPSGYNLMGVNNQFNNFSKNQIVGVSALGGPLGIRHADAAVGKYWYIGPTNSANNIVVYNQGNVGVYMIDGATAWTATSDERFKDIIEPITDAASKVASLRSVIGKYKTDPDGTRRAFLIAQDVQSVLPEAVSRQEDEAGTLGVAYTDVIPLLVAAIKEQQKVINQLKADVAALKQA